MCDVEAKPASPSPKPFFDPDEIGAKVRELCDWLKLGLEQT
jgi:hypothetical protein